MEQPSPRRRYLVLLVLGVLWMGAVLARLSYLQLFRYSDYLALAHRQQQRIVEISPERGVLYDRNGRELARSIAVDSCFAVPAEISDPEMVARLLSGVVGFSPEELETRLASSRSFAWVARKLTPEAVRRIQALNLRGIYFQKENQRFYPERELAAHVLGHVDIDEHGLAGIEYALDRQIRGRPGRMLVLADARHRWYNRNEQAADAGSGVVLTLDENIQYIAEKELAAAVQQTHALGGSVVVEDPNTGELLAVANWPTFDPNEAGQSPPEARMDRAISALYEPGSTFKIVLFSAALDQNVTSPELMVDCQMGSISIAGHRIHDWKPFGLLTVAQVLAHSSDVGSIKIGLELGPERFYGYIHAFGFGEPTGIELPGESHGLLRPVDHWSAISIGAVSIGQELGVTAVQLLGAVSAVANGGLLYRPRIVREIRKGSEVLTPPQPAPRRVIRPTTAATMRRLMEGVILEGTGRKAQLAGYTAGGKSGTAQKLDPATGRYSRTAYMASFVGFAPLNNPAISILVTLDSPQGPHHGGEVAGPVFQRIAEQTLAYLDVPHDEPIAPGLQFAVNHGRRSAATDMLNDDPSATGSAAETPLPGSHVRHGQGATTVALAGGEMVTMPALVGQTVRTVTEQCSRLGLNPLLVGTGIALTQVPAAGVQLPRGSRVTVRFERSAVLPVSSRKN
jgi:cell division protein FtsI (penicillin-binding protein 3)